MLYVGVVEIVVGVHIEAGEGTEIETGGAGAGVGVEAGVGAHSVMKGKNCMIQGHHLDHVKILLQETAEEVLSVDSSTRNL